MREHDGHEGIGVVKPQSETFLEFLNRTPSLDCDLIIGGTEMPASFVWDEDIRLTVYGIEYYAAILQAPYTLLQNGNIEIHCDNDKLGEHFTLAAAGHIGDSEYRKLFTTMELTREHIAIDQELVVEEGGIYAYIETWFDVDEKFGLDTAGNDSQSVNFYAIYHPEKDSLTCMYILRDDDKGDTEHEYYPTPNEISLIKGMMQAVCCKSDHCGLLGLWFKHTSNEGQAPEICFDHFVGYRKNRLDTLVEPWFDVDEKLPFPIPQDPDTSDVFFCALYNPDDSSMKYVCYVEFDSDDASPLVHEFELTEQEIALLKDGMEALCQEEHKCSLEVFWETEKQRNPM